MQRAVCLLHVHALAQLQLYSDITGRVADYIRLKGKAGTAHLLIAIMSGSFTRSYSSTGWHDHQVDIIGVVGDHHVNEAATLFRRKYYQNGAHAGYILYMTDAAQSSSDVDRMRQAMRDTKGLGNFRNLFMYAPNGKLDGIKILPLSEVATKDDFFNIKKASRDDLLSAHRVPPQMMGIIPDNSGGFGDAVKASQVFVRNELTPLQERFKELNHWIGDKVIESLV